MFTNPLVSHITSVSPVHTIEPGDRVETLCGKTRQALADDARRRPFICGTCHRLLNEDIELTNEHNRALYYELEERMRAIRAMAGPGTFTTEDGVHRFQADDGLVDATPWVETHPRPPVVGLLDAQDQH